LSEKNVVMMKVKHSTTWERFSTTLKGLVGTWKIFKDSRKGMIGLLLILSFVVVAIGAPYFAPENPYSVIVDNPPNAPPSLQHYLGTDGIGRDVFSMLVYGARVSLLVGIVAAIIAMLVGTSIGLIAGYFGKFAEEGLMRATDFFLVLPELVLMIILVSILVEMKALSQFGLWGPTLVVIIVIGLVSWPPTARVVRAQVLSVKKRMFVERAKAIGCSTRRIITRHVFPNVFPLIFAEALLNISNAIWAESYLAFLGLTAGGSMSWGMMIEDAWESLAVTKGIWWYVIPPGVCIVLLVLAFSLVGYALEEILNPKLRKI